jgi:DnaK suppressor protein
MQNYQSIRNRMVERYDEISQRLAKVSRDLRHADDPLKTIMDEQSIELENDEVLGVLDESIREEMERIDRTLTRLDQGEYGQCEGCGRMIPVRRLEALPFTTRCVECEEGLETRYA